MTDKVDVAIIGGGVMGASSAYWLSLLAPQLRILVLERDPSHSFSSTALSVASIRQQFSAAINVRVSQFGLAFIRGFAARSAQIGGLDLCFRGNGYLFLAQSARGVSALRRNTAMQNREGARTELLTRGDLRTRFPWMSVDDITLAGFGGTEEGWFDNMGLLSGLRSLAQSQGVRFEKAEVVDMARRGRVVTSLHLSDGRRIQAGEIVNATGPRAAQTLAMLGEDIPVEPRKRTVFVVDAPDARQQDAPLIIDFQGYYARPEGDSWITATIPDEDPKVDVEDFSANHWEFDEFIWPRLYRRIPGFERARVLRHWVGHYAYNRFDQNALLGRHPGLDNLILVNGFSGHGLQQAPAMGRGVAELLLHGGFRSLDLSDFGYERIVENRPFPEDGIV